MSSAKGSLIDSAAFFSRLAPPLHLQTWYFIARKRDFLLNVVKKYTEGKVHGASSQALHFSEGRKLNKIEIAAESFIRSPFRQCKGLHWLLSCISIFCINWRQGGHACIPHTHGASGTLAAKCSALSGGIYEQLILFLSRKTNCILTVTRRCGAEFRVLNPGWEVPALIRHVLFLLVFFICQETGTHIQP